MSTKVKTEDIENIATSVWTPWTDDNIPTEKAVRDAIDAAVPTPWWPIDWLDGIITGSNTASAAGNINYRANYRWDSTWTWSGSANGAWYKDNFVYTTIAWIIRKHNLNWDIVASLVAASSWWLIFSNNSKDFLFTANNSQKVVLSTMTNWWNKWLPLWDLSPSWNIWVSFDDSVFTGVGGTLTFKYFDTATMADLYTRTIVYTTYPANNKFNGITFLDDTTVVIVVTNWLNWANDPRIIKYNFVTNTVLVDVSVPNALWPWSYWETGSKRDVMYNPTNDTLYYCSNENYSWSATRPRIWTVNKTTLSWTVFLSTNENVYYFFKSNDWSLCMRYVFTGRETKFLVKNNTKFWNWMVTWWASWFPVSQIAVVQ